MRRTGVEDLIRRRRGGEDGDAKLTDLLVRLADCPKARSVSIHDRCKAVAFLAGEDAEAKAVPLMRR